MDEFQVQLIKVLSEIQKELIGVRAELNSIAKSSDDQSTTHDLLAELVQRIAYK